MSMARMKKNQMTRNIQVSDFITIPAWNVTGLVCSIEPAMYGPEDAIDVLLNESPETDDCVRYHLENGQCIIEDL